MAFFLFNMNFALAQDAKSIVNTLWRGIDNGRETEIKFLPNGRASYSYHNGVSVVSVDKVRWSQNGSNVYWEINDKFVEKKGQIKGDTLTGTAQNIKGAKWSFSYKLVQASATQPVRKLSPVDAFNPNKAVPNCDNVIAKKFAHLETFGIVAGKRQGVTMRYRNNTYNRGANLVMYDAKRYGNDNLYYVYFIDLRTWSNDRNMGESSITAHCIFNGYSNQVSDVKIVKD